MRIKRDPRVPGGTVPYLTDRALLIEPEHAKVDQGDVDLLAGVEAHLPGAEAGAVAGVLRHGVSEAALRLPQHHWLVRTARRTGPRRHCKTQQEAVQRNGGCNVPSPITWFQEQSCLENMTPVENGDGNPPRDHPT